MSLLWYLVTSGGSSIVGGELLYPLRDRWDMLVCLESVNPTMSDLGEYFGGEFVPSFIASSIKAYKVPNILNWCSWKSSSVVYVVS